MTILRISFIALLLTSGTVFGQIAPATTVQLPTFAFTTVNTTANVPDQGSVILGGVDRLSEGRTERGLPILSKIPMANRLFKNVGIGRQTQSIRQRVAVKILIQDELEEEVMGRAYDARAARGDRRTFDELLADYQAQERVQRLHTEERRGNYLARQLAQQRQQIQQQQIEAAQFALIRQQRQEQQREPELPDPEEIRRRNEAVKQQRTSEATQYFEKAKSLENSGKLGAARVYYKMAARRAGEDLKQEIQVRLDALQK